MSSLNYKHLHYFWAVAKAGGIARASEQLHLTPQTVSGQLTLFEKTLGYKLFTRATAEAVFLAEPQLCGATADAYYRHGCEAVMSVEALQAGAHLALVRRSTFNEQPVSSFGPYWILGRPSASRIGWLVARSIIGRPTSTRHMRHIPTGSILGW